MVSVVSFVVSDPRPLTSYLPTDVFVFLSAKQDEYSLLLSWLLRRVKLLNPQEDYCKIMNDVRVLGHFLNFVRKLPNASTAAAEQDLQKMCRCFACP